MARRKGKQPRRASTRPARTVSTKKFIGLIRAYLDAHHMTQAEFAAKAQIGPSVLSRLLNNESRRPEEETVVKLAHAMELPVWTVAVAAGYPYVSPEVPSPEDERLLRLIQADPAIRDVLERYFATTEPGKRESLLRLGVAILEAGPR